MPFGQVAILGLGLIGSSLGLALRQRGEAERVVGFDTNTDRLRWASRAGAVDRTYGMLSQVCAGSQVIILATPVGAITQLIGEIGGLLEGDALVTDTGGTKARIVEQAERLLPSHASFVGGHPLTGRLTAGVEEPSASLFAGITYCLTPSAMAPGWAVDRAIQLVEAVGAQPYFLDPFEHDALVAAVSHLPYFAAVSLMASVAAQPGWSEMGAMAAGGFRAASALVEADPESWLDVAATNQANIVRQIDYLIQELYELRDLVEQNSPDLMARLRAARDARRAWLGSGSLGAGAGSPTGWTERARRP